MIPPFFIVQCQTFSFKQRAAHRRASFCFHYTPLFPFFQAIQQIFRKRTMQKTGRRVCLPGENCFFTESWGKSSLEARLRTRKVTGRDASLPAPLLATSLGLVGRGTVGALPQPPQGTLSLDPARGRQKGTKSPLDPFSRLSWSHFHAPSACSFLVLRLSPCFFPQLSVKNQKICVQRAAELCGVAYARSAFRPSRPAVIRRERDLFHLLFP